jgi:GNAT superfamily N-acetyltransferase
MVAASQMVEVRVLSASEALQHVSGLAAVLVDCVEGGASVSFMLPFGQPDAEEFFRKVAAGVEAGERILLAALVEGELVGTVQILPAMPPNQPHRAEIAKLLVRRSARGRGVARLLMEEAERQAALAGKMLLVLDTASDHAERLYKSMNWVRVGDIPKFALFPDGRWTDTTIFFKTLDSDRLVKK